MSDYWLRRALEDERRAHRLAGQTSAELKKVYQRQYKRVYAQMERLYGQIDWGDTLQRTQLWQYSRWKEMEKGLRSFATETPRIGIDKITQCLDKVFEETIGADINRFSGRGSAAFSVAGDAAAVINTAWSGESFSARIWKNTAAVAERIRSDMEDMVVTGRSLGDIKYRLMQDFSIAYNDASRLVDTEAAYVMNSAAKQRYSSAGLTKIRWSIAPEDGRECEICKSRANKVWHIANAPPMPAHPRCRCVWVGVYELPGEYVPCDGEGESIANLKTIEAPEKLGAAVSIGKTPAIGAAQTGRTAAQEIALERRKAENMGEMLKKSLEYGIIETNGAAGFRRILDSDGNEKYRYLQTNAIQKLASAEEIAAHFQYTDPWGDERSPIDASFSALRLEAQKEAAEGIEWARTAYGLARLPNSIQAAKLGKSTYGVFNPREGTLLFRKGLSEEEAFATAVHEMTHYAQLTGRISAEEIVEQARKSLKMDARSRKYYNQRIAIVGGAMKYMDDARELLAYSLERHATNRANELAEEISRVWLERVGKK